MTRSRERVVTLLSLWAMAGVRAAHAQSGDGGRVAAPILLLPASPRAAALAESFAAVARDEAALFYAPAQLATVRAGASASVERFLATTVLAAGSAATRVGRVGTFALGVQSLAYDAAEETRGDFEPTGRTLTGGELVVTGGWGRALPALAGVRVGVAGKLVTQRVAEATGRAGAVDVSLAWGGDAADTRADAPASATDARRALAATTVAVAVQNVGGELRLLGRGAPLPRRLRVGAAMPIVIGPRVRLLATAELSQLRGEAARPSAGAEVRWQAGAVALDARVGVRRRFRDEALPAGTVGGGLTVRRIAVDYAYQDYALLGGTHRLGLRWAR